MQFQKNIFIKGFVTNGLLLIVMLLSINAIGQPSVKIGDMKGCNNTEILIPFSIENFEDVAALTLFIKVDTSNIDYVGIENVNDIFSEGDLIGGINYDSQLISLNWFSITAANIDSGLMCNMRVLLKNGNATFDFQENCEFVRSNLSIIENVEYANGTISNLSTFAIQPNSQTLIEGGLANIEMLDIPNGVSCAWQIMEGGDWLDLNDEVPFSGVSSFQLSIDPITLDLNESSFRCLLSIDVCSTASNESLLQVIPNGITEMNGFEQNVFTAYPNPTTNSLTCHFNMDVSLAEIKMISTKGKLVLYEQIGNVTKGQENMLNTTDLKPGNYILQLCENGKIITSLKIIKQ